MKVEWRRLKSTYTNHLWRIRGNAARSACGLSFLTHYIHDPDRFLPDLDKCKNCLRAIEK